MKVRVDPVAITSPERRSIAAAEPLRARAGSEAAWRFHALCQLEDFAATRRRLGDASASALVRAVTAAIERDLPDTSAQEVGRNLIELEFFGADVTELEHRLAEIRATCEMLGEDVNGGEPIGLIFGTAAAPAAMADPLRLADEAEVALHEARTVGHPVNYDSSMPPRAVRKLAAEIERALDNEELVLHYQPKLHLRRQEISSVEALVRWQHPERGLVPPGEFIPVTEKSHLAARLTLWAIQQAIKDQARLAAGGHDLRVFINISGQLLANAPFVRAACELVASSEAKLGFEVTETSVIRDPARAIANLQVFADIGIVIAIDDYGAGLSSLAYLKQLPARELKIDKLFITQLTSSNRDPLIVRSTIDLAHALEMEVVAEGVETHAALALLTVMGCDLVQGFLISRPVPIAALQTFMDEDRRRETSTLIQPNFGQLAIRRQERA